MEVGGARFPGVTQEEKEELGDGVRLGQVKKGSA